MSEIHLLLSTNMCVYLRPRLSIFVLRSVGGWTKSTLLCCGLKPGVCVFALCLSKEFEIELEGSQTLRLLCYEKCCHKTKQSKEDGEIADKIMAKGQIKVPAN